MTLREKAVRYMAKYQTLSNAAEFIRSHGEEGHSFHDGEFDKAYNREKYVLAKQLDARAKSYLNKYLKLEIDINTEVDRDY